MEIFDHAIVRLVMGNTLRHSSEFIMDLRLALKFLRILRI